MTDWIDKLTELRRLRATEAITEAEFEARRTLIFAERDASAAGSPPPPAQEGSGPTSDPEPLYGTAPEALLNSEERQGAASEPTSSEPQPSIPSTPAIPPITTTGPTKPSAGRARGRPPTWVWLVGAVAGVVALGGLGAMLMHPKRMPQPAFPITRYDAPRREQVLSEGLNVRVGPGSGYGKTAAEPLTLGQVVVAVGEIAANDGGRWAYVQLPDGSVGYVNARLLGSASSAGATGQPTGGPGQSTSASMVASGGATMTAPGATVDWDLTRDGDHHAYSVGDLIITLSSAAGQGGDGDDPTAMTIRASDGAAITVKGAASAPAASFLATRLDPAQSGLGVIYETFSGGAHCCRQLSYIERFNGAWRTVDLGSFEGEGIGEVRDGGGTRALEVTDDRFAYAFDSFAGSFLPAELLTVRDGTKVDVSSDPAFRAVHERDYQAAMKGCLQHGNGACAGLVAAGMRLGRGAETWRVMLANYDPEAARSTGWPQGCRVRMLKGACPKGLEITYPDMPTALAAFLMANGYGRAPTA